MYFFPGPTQCSATGRMLIKLHPLVAHVTVSIPIFLPAFFIVFLFLLGPERSFTQTLFRSNSPTFLLPFPSVKRTPTERTHPSQLWDGEHFFFSSSDTLFSLECSVCYFSFVFLCYGHWSFPAFIPVRCLSRVSLI